MTTNKKTRHYFDNGSLVRHRANLRWSSVPGEALVLVARRLNRLEQLRD
jgi:hypothetical protein